MADLKVCPFCGGEAKDDHYSAYSLDSSFDYIGCSDCGAMIEYEGKRWNAHESKWDHSGRDEAIAAWNRRAPDPRDEVIRKLVEAASALLAEAHRNMRGGKGHLLDNMDAAIDAARKLVRQPYMGQIMAECDCQRQDECQRAGRCIAEVR